MPRATIGPFIGGLDLVTDPNMMGAAYSPNCQDMRFNRGIGETRPGYNVLGCEPSRLDGVTSKDLWGLTFDSASSESGTATFTQTLGRAFSVIADLLCTETANGTYVMFRVYDGAQTVLMLQYIVASGNVSFKLTLRDAAGGTWTGTTVSQSTAAWGALRNYIVATCNGGSPMRLYIGGTLVTFASTTGSATPPFAASANLYVSWDGAGFWASQRARQLVFLNRNVDGQESFLNVTNFSEDQEIADSYIPMGYPVDAILNDPDVLLHYTFIEGTGTTVTDWSRYGATLTLTNTPSWPSAPGGQHLYGRGLGMFVYRPKSGTRYNVLGFQRNGSNSANTGSDACVYLDRVDRVWAGDPNAEFYYIGGSAAADDSSPSLTGLTSFARMCFAQGGDYLLLVNGRDLARKYLTTWQYLGGTAPASAPIIAVAAGTNNWKYAYSYYSLTEKTETGLSPSADANNATVATTVSWFVSPDAQFSHVRIWRSKNGETVYRLITEQPMGTGGPYVDNSTDAQISSNPIAPGGDLSGNRRVKRGYLTFPDYRPEDLSKTSQREPPSAPTLAVTGGAGSLSAGTYRVAYSYRSSTTLRETGLSPTATQTGVIANDRLDISGMVLPGAGTEYDQIRIYRTVANGLLWYLDQTITAAATATSTQADSTLDDGETLTTRALPPKCQYIVEFANRIWMAGDPDFPGMVYWSTAGDYEAFAYDNAYAPRGASIAVTALWATEAALYISFEDGACWILPHPGDELDLVAFVPLNITLFSKFGGCVGHFTAQATNIGTLWLGRDGVYNLNGSGLARVSNRTTPYFRILNGARARYATAVFKDDESLYLLSIPRGYYGKSRLNDSWIGYYTDGDAWNHDSLPPCDVAGVLEDAQRNRRYCFIMPTGILCELLSKQIIQSVNPANVFHDGNPGGTVSGTVAGATMVSFTDIGGRTVSPGFDGGYAVWFLRTSGTTSVINAFNQRWVLRVGAPFQTGINFFPLNTALPSATYTAYLSAIRNQWATAKLDFGFGGSFKTVTDTHAHLCADGTTFNVSVGAALNPLDAGYSVFMKLPDVVTAPSIYTGLQHTTKLILTGDFLDVNHGGWNAIGTSRGRRIAILYVNHPPQKDYGWAIKAVDVVFDLDPMDGQT